MRTILLIASATAVLTACQKTPGANTTAQSATPAPGPTASATGMPHRRAGLWEQTVSADNKAPIMGSMKICVGPDSDAQDSLLSQRAAGAAHSACGAPTVTRGLDGSLTFAATCPTGEGGTATTTGTATGDFSSNYKLHLQSVITGSKIDQMNGSHTTDIEGKWVGPCPADMAAGDIEFANGMKLGRHSLAGAAAAAQALRAGH